MPSRTTNALVIAGLTTVFDIIFHVAFTEPFELPTYFLAKFLIAFSVAYLYLKKVGPVKTAIIFTLTFDVLYYFLLVYILQIPGISVWTPTNPLFIFGDSNIYYVGVVETFVHGFFFLVAATATGAAKEYSDVI